MPDTESEGPVVSVQRDMDPAEPATGEEEPLVPIMGTVTLKHSMYPKGYELEVPGLGTIPNMGTKRVDVVQAANFEIATNQKWPDGEEGKRDLTIQIPPPEPEPEVKEVKK